MAFLTAYKSLNKKYFCFACDLFGNQFCFKDEKIVFFNIETCEEEFLTENFLEWCNIILSDSNYYTGESILLGWEDVLIPLPLDQRLIPKIPFVIGGEYSPKNMISSNFFKVMDYNASIAKQIYNTPDGTQVELILGATPE